FEGSWRPVFFILAVPGILCYWLMKKYVADSPKTLFERGKVKKDEYDMITAAVSVEASEHGKKYSSKAYATDIQFYLFTASYTLMLMIYWGMTTWISTFLVKQHGMNLKTMGFYASMPYVVAFFAMYIGGWMADTWFPKKPRLVAIIAFLGCIPVLYFIGHVPKGETNMLLMWLCLGGFFINLPWGLMFSYPGLRYPKEIVGRAVGTSNGVGQFGAFISPMIAGYLVITLPDKTYDFGNVFVFWSLLAVVGTMAVAFLDEKAITDPAISKT
ncbi:MAG TPA: MFS transporter, partial [Syntrophales bacterium]|nr:MFS transporter [Syntrophales bacterium]